MCPGRVQDKAKAAELAKGELYLWAWCEMNLRYREISAHPNTEISVEIRTDDLYVPERMSARFDALGLSCRSPLISEGYVQ